MSNHPHESLSQEFQRFAKEVVHASSPLYERLSLAIAQDPEMLALVSHARKGERVPNLFFAAVHFLLLKGTEYPLSVFYRSISRARAPDEDPYPKFRSFCLEHNDEIRRLISVGLVQTNEVSRCVFLMPAFVFVSRQGQGRPLYLVEIGASAGLNLLWDRYGYNYGEGHRCGDLDSLVQLTCSLRGSLLPPIAEKLPAVSFRVGIDHNPIDVRDPEVTLWLRAFIWPEHEKRAELLQRAVQVAQQDPSKLIAGDATEVLSAVLGEVPKDVSLCIFRTFTALSPKARERLSSLLSELGAGRDLFLVYAKPHRADESELRLVSFVNGVQMEKLLAYFQNHGEWLEWLEGDLP